MEIRYESINGNSYEFINQYKSTRNGFKHETYLVKNGREIAHGTCNYINRTYERYTYQSSMKNVVYGLLNELETDFIRAYKKMNNVKRLTKTRKEECMELIKEDFDYKELKELLDRLENR